MKTEPVTGGMEVIQDSIIELDIYTPLTREGFRYFIAINATGGNWEFLYSCGGDYNFISIDDFDWSEIAEDLPEIIKSILRLRIISEIEGKETLCDYLEERLNDYNVSIAREVEND